MVGKVLRRLGLGKLAALEPKPPVVRYQPEQPGELIHIDVKKLGRIEAVGHRIIGNPRDRRLVAAPGCAIFEPSPIPRAPTVRPSGSFRPVRASGPMRKPTPPPRHAARLLPVGLLTTTRLGRTPPWSTGPPLSDLAKPSCLVRPKGPFLRRDLARPRSAQEGPILDTVNNALGIDISETGLYGNNCTEVVLVAPYVTARC